MDPEEPVLLVGGYGVVGAQVAALLAARQPQRRIMLAGRSKDAANAAAARLANAQGLTLDITASDPLAAVSAPPALVVGLVNDPQNMLLNAALKHGAPFLDITRWTERLHDALLTATTASPRAPVVFASSWMAGAPGLAATHWARQTPGLTRIALDILYAVKDRAGPNSVEYADQLGKRFRVWQDGRWSDVKPLSEPQKVVFGRGRFTARRFATPDLELLPRLTGAHSVEVRLAYDDASAAGILAMLVGSGMWSALSGPHFEGLRRGLLYNPGKGAPHEVRVTLEGAATRVGVLSDPLGQTHMTAAATVVQIERLLDPALAPGPGLHFAETHPHPEAALSALQAMGVAIQWQS